MKQGSFAHSLAAILVKQGNLSDRELEKLSKAFETRSSDTIVDFLLEEGMVEREDLLRALSTYYEVPALDVTGYMFDHNLVHFFPKDVLTNLIAIPADIEQDILMVVTDNPNKENLLPGIAQYSDAEVELCVGIAQDILDAIEEFYDKSLTAEDEDELIDEEIDVVEIDEF